MLSRRVALCIDYARHMNRFQNSQYEDPFAIGVNIETGGHVFQLMISNSQSSNEPGFLANAEGEWKTGNVFLGLISLDLIKITYSRYILLFLTRTAKRKHIVYFVIIF